MSTGPAADNSAAEPTFRTEDCKGCPAKVIWAVTLRGGPVLLDAEPATGGTFRLIAQPGNNKPLAHVVPPKLAFGARGLRTRHLETCPKAHMWQDTWKRRIS